MPIYNFPEKNKKPKSPTINSKQVTDSLVEKILKRAKKYDPKNDPAIKAFKRRIRDIE